jgi:lactoylglutathione lyase
VTVVGVHKAGLFVADLQRSVDFCVSIVDFELLWQRVSREEYVRQIIGYRDDELHQAMLQRPDGGQCVELMDYRGVDRFPVATRPANQGAAHMVV